MIGSSPNIKGIEIGKEEHKSSLYADYILVFMSDVRNSVPCLIKGIKTYGIYSGYKLNVSETEAYAVNGFTPDQILCLSIFIWPDKGIKSLGISIPTSLEDLYKTNYTKLIVDLRRRMILPLTLSGKVDTIVINILPRLLFPFQTLEVLVPESIFQQLDCLIFKVPMAS